MADLAFKKYVARTAIVWGPSGATGGISVTNAMNLDNLAAGAAYQGVYADLGDPLPAFCTLEAWIESGTAPTAGSGLFEVWLAWHYTTFGTGPGGTVGTDSTYTAANRSQVGRIDAWVYPLNSGNTLQKGPRFRIIPKARYVSPVGYLGWNQNVRNQTTDSDNLSRIILTPYDEKLTDTA